ncbi:hypothetical protein VII_002768 [Vibrio mimicus MB451]|nr:hypothetical protein VII_002768 [Vibrio mimicus MB451]
MIQAILSTSKVLRNRSYEEFLQKKTTQNCVVGMGKAINLRQLKNQFPD